MRARDLGGGPPRRALAVLAISALAVIATSPLPPTLDQGVIGEVVVGGGESVERELRIHVDPAAGGARSGVIEIQLQAASGLQRTLARDVGITLSRASDASGPFAPSRTFPVERCARGCDLTYGLVANARGDVLPGSVVRYEVDVRLEYSRRPPQDTKLLRLELDGAATGPVTPAWSILAGLLAFVAGIALGPRLHGRLPSGQRRWPSLALLAVVIALIAWVVLPGLIRFGPIFRLSPLILIADPWSIALLGTLAWGLWRGLRRWPHDGGWLLGLAGVATVGLGGLWLAFWSTLGVVVQPVLLPVPFVLLGGLGGVVIGQAWRTDAQTGRDRWWAGLSVLSHGIVIAGLGFVADVSVVGFAPVLPTSPLAVIPAAFVAWAFQRWLGGRRGWLVLFDLLIAGVGLLGLGIWTLVLPGLLFSTSRPIATEDVGVTIAVVAALVAVVTSFHRMGYRAEPDLAAASELAAGDVTDVTGPAPLVDDPSTT